MAEIQPDEVHLSQPGQVDEIMPLQVDPVADAATASMTSPNMTPDTNPGRNEEANQLYTAGRYYATRRTADGMLQAIERLERAVEKDPGLALAHSELADCYALLNWYVEPPPPDAWQHAKRSATRAVEADPQLAEARASLGFVKLHFDRDWEGAESELRKAIELKPGVQVAHRWYAYSLSAMGRHEEAADEIERAREISPQSPVIATALANVLFLAGKYDATIEQCRKALNLDPGAVAAFTFVRVDPHLESLRPDPLFEQMLRRTDVTLPDNVRNN